MSEHYDLMRRLDDFARIDPAPGYWIETENGDAYDCKDYCRECAEKKMAERLGMRLCGDGGSWRERDSCRHCATCGVVLGYMLTNYGVRAEIEHFARHPPTAPLHRDDAFHIARVVGSGCLNPDALALARRAVAILPSSAGTEP